MAFQNSILVSILAFAAGPAMAQIPNASFEQWSDQGGYSEPDGWITYNDVNTPQGYFTTVEPGSPGAAGSIYAWIQSRTTQSGSVIQGWMSAAPAGHGAPAGFAYAARPAEFTGQWQYGIQPGDTARILVSLAHTVAGTRELIAAGELDVTGDLDAWSAFSVPLTYFNNTFPDTAYIEFTASKEFSSPVAGSFLKVDDLAFTGWVGLAERNANTKLILYPSPATDLMHVQCDAQIERIYVVDAMGRSILEKAAAGNSAGFDLSTLASGTYIMAVVLANGARSVQRFEKR
jgi:hypothetical protein